ncbi:heparan N-sulfatase [Coraliomargarita sinensis]|uniref:Heparan N-sulfatase n=1 Tax=Coraliomargarita sinensis TaxID=2174842 RepID=A0A317ZH02_9BACT|nr:sulfatase [Coraliomargarita sinensis]PXA04720.1 heparan N-sulfatase [Coraliomargarita sinensis]
MSKCTRIGLILVGATICSILYGADASSGDITEGPNILVVLSDDQSWPHAGAYGTDWLSTPHFDTLAREGVLFNNAFVSAPSCAPSRASILAGRHFYQMEEGGIHGGFIPAKFPLYTHLLEASGYRVGYTGKSCGPFWENDEVGQQKDPYGRKFNQHRISRDKDDIHSWNNIDYAANFREFLSQHPDRPFHFTFSSWEPHRPYRNGAAEAHGLDPARLDIPSSLPDATVVRRDFNEYAYEIDELDRDIGRFISILKEHDLYKNTIIVVTSDNGMPFPHAKMQSYEYGHHVPFVISWPAGIEAGAATDALVSVPEVAAFFLEAAGCDVPSGMMATTLPNILNLDGFTQNPVNPFVVWGKEKHNPAREWNRSYPIRALRTDEFLLVKNYEPERWPAGPPPHYKDFMWRDSALAMAHILENRKEPGIQPFFDRYTRKRPALELFDLRRDVACLHNLAQQDNYRELAKRLEVKLDAKLIADGDPRAFGNGELFESTPSLFSNPKDPDSGEPIFENFPASREPVPGLRTFRD